MKVRWGVGSWWGICCMSHLSGSGKTEIRRELVLPVLLLIVMDFFYCKDLIRFIDSSLSTHQAKLSDNFIKYPPINNQYDIFMFDTRWIFCESNQRRRFVSAAEHFFFQFQFPMMMWWWMNPGWMNGLSRIIGMLRNIPMRVSEWPDHRQSELDRLSLEKIRNWWFSSTLIISVHYSISCNYPVPPFT